MARQTFAYRPAPAEFAGRSMVNADRPVLRPRTAMKSRLMFAIGPTIMIALGATVVASAQSNSPFANKKKVNAWELPGAGTVPQGETQTTTTAPANAPRRGLQLRSRTLSPETAAAPPPGSSAAATKVVTPKAVNTDTNATPAPTQSVPSENYVYQADAAPAPTPLAGTTRPYTGPIIRESDLMPGGASAATSYQPGVYQSTQPRTGAYQGGSYANVPRGSVNAPPSGLAGGDDTDWTVHQLPSQNRPFPGKRGGMDLGRYEAQSQNPTAYDYGYRREGEAPPQTRPNQTPSGNPYGQYGGGDPHSGPLAGPKASPYGAPGPNSYGQPDPQAKRGFFSRISSLFRGGIRGGVAARDKNGWEEAFVGDADIELELSTITQGGIEWGVHGQARAQYDEGRKGFTRRLPDCPPTIAGCPAVLVAGVPTSVRGHTSQSYTSGPDIAKDTQVAIESAHLFLRSAYGDVTVGRDDGAAYLFSLGAPSLLNVAASNSGVDYTGLDAVKTLNDASGFSEKITYTSPRLLGDQVGVGVQFGVSYALDSSACGVDYCVDVDDVPNVIAPDVQDVMEAGIALDRTFAPGMSAELTATYAQGSEKSGLAGLDDLQAFGAGLELRMRDFTLGGSYLNSNQGLQSGDYEAYDVGVTWQPSVLGFTVGYGHANDSNVGLTSDQITGGVTYDVNEKIRIGAGVQYSDRDTRQNVAGTAQTVNDKATAIFIEAGITF